jgi:hypothetical protein
MMRTETPGKGWVTVKPEHTQYEIPKKNKFTEWTNDQSHMTNKHNADKPKRKTKREQQLTRHSNWKTEQFGEDVTGPGMKSGPIVPIGSAAEQGAWDRAKEGKSQLKEGFLGVNRRIRGDSSHHSSQCTRKSSLDDDDDVSNVSYFD